ncbi:hydantoinase/oxoprolinase family protein [Jeotgalibaca ciconiae]|nr:hydantoinase/oxoprolinase family protein [Jeotgalibaca ciconiae]
MRSIRIGIDVGGTHTKAVAIDNQTVEIVGKGSVMTTHHHEKGVAQGVVDAFKQCLDQNNIKPEEVIFIAHSTTQATNALLEGDVSKAGIIGMGKGGIEGFFARRQTKTNNIDLGNGKKIEVESRYLKAKDITEKTIEQTIDELINQGVNVIVASKAFGVDDAREETLVSEIARKKGLLSTSASEITKLYGLATRTKTATLNASILPTMLETANSTENSVKEAGIQVPLMIMRGDGGVMEVTEMKKRPILTMLSGPAASVSGALMYLRTSNAVFVEVGGTSTDISVIKNGKPAVDYSIIGGHRTYINSLDVHVTGVAGGSMVRANNSEVVDVGPRSAHIADMGYVAFTPPELFEGAEVYRMKPTENDPSDYVAIRLNNGESVALTNTCAANALKLVSDDDFAKGIYESSYVGVKLLADELGKTVEETADAILDASSKKIIPIIEDLIEKYDIEREQVVVVGAGGGAGALVRYTANKLDMMYQIPDQAEVISSIGVALAMVREMVERTVPNPTVEDIAQLKKEAKDLAIKSGAVEDTIEVYVEIDEQAQKITAIALGSTEVRTTDLSKDITLEEAQTIASETIKDVDGKLVVDYTNGKTYCFSYNKGEQNQLRIIDNQGFLKIQRGHGGGQKVTFSELDKAIVNLWNTYTNYGSEIRINPDIYLIDGMRILDYSGIPEVEQVVGLIQAELVDFDPDQELYVVAAKNGL